MRVIDATGVDIAWERVELTADIIAAHREELPAHVVESIRRTRVG
jgi:hypothetical protein